MNSLRTTIRFLIIVVFLILLVFLSIFLFKLIPKAVNQLATASLSVTGLNNTGENLNNKTSEIATTTGSLNGSVITSNTGNNDSQIQILDKNSNTKTNTVIKKVYYPVYQTPSTGATLSGYKNIKISLLSLGIIDRNSGQFIATNSFNRNDVVSVRYKIENTKDTNTGSFDIRVDMPTSNVNDRTRYHSLNLTGYDAYQVEARFDGIDNSSTPIVKIYTDINNQVSETDESDNSLSVSLNSVNNNYNNNTCYYSNGNYYNCNNNYNNNNGNGTSNLYISSIEIGKIVNNEFKTQNSFVYGDKVALRVRVRNNGDYFSNTWSTRTTFYAYGTYKTVVTDNERPVNNNEESIILIQTNDTIGRGNTSFNVTIDSNNTIYESNENDNNSSISVYTY